MNATKKQIEVGQNVRIYDVNSSKIIRVTVASVDIPEDDWGNIDHDGIVTFGYTHNGQKTWGRADEIE